ncbi:hypothetical protein CWS33_29115, partial [Escherichia coli]
ITELAQAGDEEQRHQQDACKQVSERMGWVAHVGVLGDGRRRRSEPTGSEARVYAKGKAP